MDTKQIEQHVGKLVTIKVFDDSPPRDRSSEQFFGHLLGVEPAPGNERGIRVLLNEAKVGRDMSLTLHEDRFSVEPGEKVVISAAALSGVDQRLIVADQQMRDAASVVNGLTGKIATLRAKLPPANGLGNSTKLLEQVTTLEAERSLKGRTYKDLVRRHAELKYLRSRIWTGLIKSARRQYQEMCRSELDQYVERLETIITSAVALAAKADAITDGAPVAGKVLNVKRNIEGAISIIKAL